MKTIKFHIILLLLSMIWNFSLAQNYINYTEKDGLASNHVYRARQDHDGFIWFLTDKGMSKFDGKTFKNFTVKDGLPANDIWNMRITPDNRVWFFTRSDNLGYIQNDSVYSFKSDNGDMMNPNGPIFQSGNDISIVNSRYAFHFVDSIWQSYKSLEGKIDLLNRDLSLVSDATSTDVRIENRQGQTLLNLKAKPASRNYYQFNDSLLVNVQDDFYEIVNLNSLRAITGDISNLKKSAPPHNLTWFSMNNGFLQLSGGSWLLTFDQNFEIKETFAIPPQLKATHNFKDRDGFIWAATNKEGVYKLPIDYSSISSYFEGKKISKLNEINGDVLVAVEDEGVYKLGDQQSRLWLKEPLDLSNLMVLNESICYNFRFHLILEQRETFHRIEIPDVTFGMNLLFHHGSYFMEGNSGMSRLKDNFELMKAFRDPPYYQGLIRQNDTVFSFSFKKMLFYNSEIDEFLTYKDQRIQKKLLTSTTIENITYIGTEGDGLYVFQNGHLNKLIADDSAIINHISLENEHSIWVVSEGTLLHYYKEAEEAFSVKKYNQINGFPTNNLTEVLFRNNQIYLGSMNGLTVIDKERIDEDLHFTPYVKSILLNNKTQSKDSVVHRYERDLNLNVKFGSINFFDSNHTTFQYQLFPIQNSWTSTESGEVNLYDLQPEEYVLQLKVTHNDTNQHMEVPIIITPRWWQTETALTAYFLAFVASLALILLLIVRYFENKLRGVRSLAQLELKALRSQMNPHFVHNSLNAIQYYIQRHEVELSENYLAKFSKLIRLFFEYSRRRSITLKEEVNLLEEYLQIEKMRFEDKLEYDIRIDESMEPEEQIIPSMILQPIVENAVNHGVFHKNDIGKVEIAFNQINHSTFEVIIKDDGIGVNKAKELYKSSSRKYQSRSSAVLNERIALLNESKNWNITYSIVDRSTLNDSHGTLVRLTFNQFEHQ